MRLHLHLRGDLENMRQLLKLLDNQDDGFAKLSSKQGVRTKAVSL